MSEPLLRATGLTKQYGQVKALQGADFDVHAGEVVALIGDNGAGKSTLVRMLSGSEQADEGTVEFDGRTVELTDPIAARRLGIETVFQDLALAPHLDPIQNLFLGREVMRKGLLGRLGFMDTAAMRASGRKSFDSLGSTVRSFSTPIGAMSGGQKQSIAVARAAAWASKVIFLDEPTAALGVVQTKGVLDLIRRVRDEGIGVVFISHSMPHVLEVSDRVQVMRHGRRVATYAARDSSVEQLVGAMTGALDVREPAA
ncbi:ATP-binding cassette domain-containing protein [Pseudokineococcus lusitanus]|jgi:simple sugar transport system ATP-binding protein|uniref:Monosaccharide ABC transporter ATP-binding protein (CUT2 family) n=1 Tax=Pseudokineococcus lusitanus TaxID=763993 RepID=A0A3N1HQL9_9ACTN|nr:ATP-binding cassette domain-containing protein [Pseudokineococcus lusitanus]ROP44726.1 monosaccharide ABC transporter ATP-binding protein (CUT2 family) [Pseudokineococcus lusitanus]